MSKHTGWSGGLANWRVTVTGSGSATWRALHQGNNGGRLDHDVAFPIASAAIITIAAIAAGHLMGGALPEIRHAMAIAGAMRNVGLALLIASANQTPAVVEVVIISYAMTAIIIVSG